MAVEPLDRAGELRKSLHGLRCSVSNILRYSNLALTELALRWPLESEYPGKTPGECIEALKDGDYPITWTCHVSTDGETVYSGEIDDKDRERSQRWRERKYGWPLVLDQLSPELQRFRSDLHASYDALEALSPEIARELDRRTDGGNWMLKVKRTLNDLDAWCQITSPDGNPVREFIQVLESDGLPQWHENVESLTHYIGDLRELRGESDVVHATDYRSVRWFGTVYSFTANQAPVIRLLHEHWVAGAPDVGDETLLLAVDSEAPPGRLSSLFRDHPAWGMMIVAGGTKGTHRLTSPTEKT